MRDVWRRWERTVQVNGHDVSPLAGRHVEARGGLLDSRVGDLKDEKAGEKKVKDVQTKSDDQAC